MMFDKKEIHNTPFMNYPILISSIDDKNGFKRWNKHVGTLMSLLEGSEGPNLTYENLEGKDLRGAILTRANLTGCRLCGANLSGTETDYNDLTGVDFTDANLAGANLSNTLLNDASFVNANLGGEARLVRSVLTKSVWTNANISAEQLSWANFTGALNIPHDIAASVALMILGSLLPSNMQPVDVTKLILKVLMPENVENVIEALFADILLASDDLEEVSDTEPPINTDDNEEVDSSTDSGSGETDDDEDERSTASGTIDDEDEKSEFNDTEETDPGSKPSKNVTEQGTGVPPLDKDKFPTAK